MGRTPSCASFGRDTLGVTSPLASPSDGVIVDADIPFNGQDWTWATGSCTGRESYCHLTNKLDLMSVAVHEIGHFDGLDHSRTLGAIMFASYDTPKQQLSNDCGNGFCVGYPSGTFVDAARDAEPFGGVSGRPPA